MTRRLFLTLALTLTFVAGCCCGQRTRVVVQLSHWHSAAYLEVEHDARKD